MIRFLNLNKINYRIREELQTSFSKSWDNAHFNLGENVSKYESESYCGTQHCISSVNGLDALKLILKGYVKVGEHKKVNKAIMSSNTFIATVSSIPILFKAK